MAATRSLWSQITLMAAVELRFGYMAELIADTMVYVNPGSRQPYGIVSLRGLFATVKHDVVRYPVVSTHW